jgi:YD repeat-containing protein
MPSDAYDAAGNLTDHPDMTAYGALMTYDGENHLLTLTSAGNVSTYDYDGEGRRVRKTTP